MKARKSVKIFTISVLLTIILFLSSLYIYDPLQIFHKPWGRKTTFHKNMRIQAAGILKNYDYDSLIFGSSMLENTSSHKASKTLGGHFINISMSGSDFLERTIVLNNILKKKHIKQVIFTLDNYGLIYLRKGDKNYPLENWAYLYDNNPINDFKMYLNKKYIGCLLSFSNDVQCIGRNKDLDRPNNWINRKDDMMRFGKLDNWFKLKTSHPMHNVFKSTQKKFTTKKSIYKQPNKIKQLAIKKYLYNTLISMIKDNKKTKFIFIIPPYSIIQQALTAQYSSFHFYNYIYSIKYLISATQKYNNVKIYGWGNHSFTQDIANYRDYWHYHPKINSWMIDAIANQEGLLNSSNIHLYLSKFTKQSLDYNLTSLEEKINTYLKK